MIYMIVIYLVFFCNRGIKYGLDVVRNLEGVEEDNVSPGIPPIG